MRPSRSRYVTACQQLLALGAVLVALVPATRVVSLDVVGEQPGTTGPTLHVRPTSDAARPSRPARAGHPRRARSARAGVNSGR